MKNLREKTRLIPVAFVLGYIPLIVRMHEYDSHFEDLSWFPVWDDGVMFDFFLYFKAAAVLIAAAVMLILYICDRGTVPLSPLSAFLLMVFLSGIMSPFRKEAFFGSAESFETVPVILSYGIIFFYTTHSVRSREDVKTILKMVFPGFAIIGLIALLQLFRADPFKTSIMRTLIIPSSRADLRESLAFTFEPGEVYATLFNSNYVTQYFGFALFIGIALMLCKGLGKRERITGAVASLISLAAIAGSRSRTGYIAVALTMAVFELSAINTILKTKNLSRLKRSGIIALITAVIAGGCIVFLSTERGHEVLKKAGIINDEEIEKQISDVRTVDDHVEIEFGQDTLIISYRIEDEGFMADLEDHDKTPVPFTLEKNAFVVSDPRFEGVQVAPVMVEGAPETCMKVSADGRELVFVKTQDQGCLYYNKAGRFVKFKKYDRSSLFPDGLFSDRGMLWNNCIRLLPDSLLLGSGAGTFAYVYPNDDDYYRLYDDGGISFFDVKAHSIYFQQFIENGGIALVCFMIFYILFAVGVLTKGIPSAKDPFTKAILWGILSGSLCYMLCGLTVDSNVTTAPVFWTLLGLALAMQKM